MAGWKKIATTALIVVVVVAVLNRVTKTNAIAANLING